jgi:DNA-directed RNA polymerase specialized sigma24 family protein
MSVPWPPCEDVYSAYGIDLETCKAAEELWRSESERTALSEIGDTARGFDLMIEAAASVTRRRENHPDEAVRDLKSYLRTSYINLIRAEQKKRKRFVHILEEPLNSARDERAEPGVFIPVTPTQEPGIYFEELKQKMALIDKQFLEVTEYRMAGYTLEEIAPNFKMSPSHLRSWFSKKMKKLQKQLEKESSRKPDDKPKA